MLAGGLLTVMTLVALAWAVMRPVEPGPERQADRVFRVRINSAEAAALELLPQVGPSRAEAIIEARERGGPFRSVVDLERVVGIAAKRAAAIAPYVRFEPVERAGAETQPASSSSGADQSVLPARQTTRPAPTPTSSLIPP
jgi:competence protein ComEA